jgi:hypothetical protein
MEDTAMKKLMAIALALMLMLALAACGGESAPNLPLDNLPSSNTPSSPSNAPSSPSNSPSSPSDSAPSDTSPDDTSPDGISPNDDPSDPDTPPTDSDPDAPDGAAMASLIKWMIDGTFSYDYTLAMEGPEGSFTGSGSMAVSGENLMVRQEMTVAGVLAKTRIIQKDGKAYMVDDVNKFIMELPAEADMTEGMVTDYTGIELVSTGTGEIGGRTLPYEEYREGESGATVKYFLDGGDVYGIISEYEGYKTTMIITNQSGSVPAGVFDLPAGYTRF